MEMDHARAIRESFTDPKTVVHRLNLADGMKASRSDAVDIRCPNHDDNTPSCSVFKGDSGTIGVKCHACDFSGDLFTLVAAVERLDCKRDFSRIKERTAEIFGYDLQDRKPPKKTTPTPKATQPAIDVEAIWNALGVVDADAVAFLELRGIKDARACRVATPDSPGKAGELAARGYRLALPLRDATGKVVAVQLRSLDDRDKRYMTIGASGSGVFGNPLVVEQVSAVLVCEGFTDYLVASTSETSGDVAVLGIAGVQADGMLEKLKVRGKRMLIATDADKAGDECAEKLAQVFAGNGAEAWRVRPTLGKDLCEHIAKGGKVGEILVSSAKLMAKPQPLPFAKCAADIKIKPVKWIWKGRIPAGMMVMVDGDPGLGKSTFLAEVTARITRGDALHGDTARRPPAGVVLVSFEDADEYTIAPRLIAAGADMKRVRIWNTDEYGFALPDSIESLEALINECAAAVVVIDPFMAALNSDTNAHKDQDVRKVMAAVKSMCDRTGASVIFIRHLNKNSDSKALHRGGGSIGIIGAARVGLVMDKDPDDEDARVLAVTKCNVGRGAPSLRFRLVEAPPPAPGIEVARVHWDGVSSATADDLLANQDEQTAIKEAMGIIKTILADGRVLASTVVQDCKGAGISEATANRAKRRLKVQSVRDRVPGPWFWELP